MPSFSFFYSLYKKFIFNSSRFNSDKYFLFTLESAMGTQINEKLCGTFRTYKDAMNGIMKVFINRFIRVYLHSDIIFNLTPMSKEQTKYVSTMHEFTDSVIKSRKEAIENNEVHRIEFEANHDYIQYTSKKKKSSYVRFIDCC